LDWIPQALGRTVGLGHLVFTADADGDLVAVNAGTGKDLWHLFMGSPLYSSALTFSGGGR
jgi:outer membrane protein assembly factor BamB